MSVLSWIPTLALFTVSAPETPPNLMTVKEERLSLKSGDGKVAIERFFPEKKEKLPALVFLHGSDGLAKRGDDYRAACRAIAARGHLVLLVHYFDLCQTQYADKAAIDKHFLTWVGIVHDAVGFARKMPEVDANRVGLIGYSLGGYVSLSAAVLAWRPEHRVGIVIEYFAGIPKLLTVAATRLPPVLILHGEDDRMVPAQEARDLQAVLKKAGVAHEMRIYPKQGHGFSEPVAKDAMELAFDFIAKHLPAGR